MSKKQPKPVTLSAKDAAEIVRLAKLCQEYAEKHYVSYIESRAFEIHRIIERTTQ